MKLISTVDPDYIRKGKWAMLELLRADIEQAKKQSFAPEIVAGAPSPRYIEHPTVAEAAEVLRVGDPRPLVFDLETNIHERIEDCRISICGFGRVGGDSIVTIPWAGRYKELAANALKDRSSPKVFHNSPFDVPRVERSLGIRMGGEWRDTLALWRMWQPDIRENKKDGIDPMDRLEVLGSIFAPELGRWKGDANDSLETYCCKDIDVTSRSFQGLERSLDRDKVPRSLREGLSMPVLRVLVDMQEVGVCVDLDQQRRVRSDLRSIREEYAKDIDRIVESLPGRQRIRDELLREADDLDATALANWVPGRKREMGKLKTRARKLRASAEGLGGLNPRSSKQVSELLTELFPKRRSKGGDDKVLAGLLRTARSDDQRGITDGIRKFREVDGLCSRYLSFEETHLHPQLLEWGAASGRFSCIGPNMQNIPSRGQYSPLIRSIFIPTEPGWEFTAVDYSQIELRLMALWAQDEELLRVFAEGKCPHRYVASLMYGVPYNSVTKSQRSYAKAGRYGKSYGMGWQTLQLQMIRQGVFLTPAEAKEVLRGIDSASPKLAAWGDEQVANAKSSALLRNPFGRIRRFMDPTTHGDAMAFRPSSTVADMMRRDMIQLADELPSPARLSMQVHDEIIVEHPPGMGPQVTKVMTEIMGQPFPELGGWSCPVDGSTGKNWKEIK